MTDSTPQTLEYAPPDGLNDRSTGGTPLGWAAYLGASWTWCIGMFLPVLLIRDYGPWAWVIFAVPNVVGAGAMGWVMRSAEQSRRYTLDHASACRLFSFVTIAFQLFFAMWMLPRLVGPVGFIAAAVIVQSAFTPITNLRWLRVGAAGALLVSVAVAAAVMIFQPGVLQWPGNPGEPWVRPDHAGVVSMGDLAGLAVVCLVGFLTCPYLDLTFHRARLALDDAGAKVAFGVGFGVLFFSMIVFTFFYAVLIIGLLIIWHELFVYATARRLISLHLFLQMTYTVHVHAAELVRQSKARDDRGVMRGGLSVWLAVGLGVGLAAAFGNEHGIHFRDRPLGEIGYRTFMSFYGLVFPAYVLLAIGRPRVSWLAWAVVTLAAMPFFWLAFIERGMAWGAAGVAVIVIGALIGRRLVPSPGTPGEG